MSESISQSHLFRQAGRPRRAYLLMVLLCVISILSCKKPETGETPKIKKDEGIHRKVERGPATLRLDIDRKEITIAERLHLVITATVDENYEIKLPAFGEKLEQFGIVDYRTSQPELTGKNRKTISRSYVLEPFLSGEYAIPAMTVMFWKKAGQKTPADKADEHKIETPEVTVTVKSLLPEDLKSVKLNEIKPPVPFPRSLAVWLWVAGAGVFLILGTGGAMLWIRRRKRGSLEEVVKRPAHELAYESLKTLIQEDLIERGEIKHFYQRISDILRRYIENRFAIRAPEQTTEEFLAGLERAPDFPNEYKGLLNTFLRHCDLVKFAAYLPQNEDIQNTFDSCKAFIQGTAEKKE